MVIRSGSDIARIEAWGVTFPRRWRCCTCGARAYFPCAVWVPLHDYRPRFFCCKCTEHGGGLLRDLRELAEIGRRQRAISDFRWTAVPPEKRVYQ